MSYGVQLLRRSILCIVACVALLMPACSSHSSSSNPPPKTLSSIALTPLSQTITLGQDQQFKATGTYSDSSSQDITTAVTWSSMTTSVATISNTAGSNGLATSAGPGTTTIQATLSGVTGSAQLMVQPTLSSIAVTPSNPTVAQGKTQQFTATGTYSDSTTQNITASVTWSSQTTSVATISNASGLNGLATAVATGSSVISAKLGSASGSTTMTVPMALTSVVVSPQYPAIPDNGATQSFIATGYYSDGSTQDLTANATWMSSNTNVASINASGQATSAALPSGSAAGYSSIRAAVAGLTGTSILSVTSHTGDGFAGVLMQRNDISRTGQNLNETSLTPANVNSTTFGKLFSQSVDGYIYAQPLYLQNVAIGGAQHNVIYVATENDSVYAFNADSATTALWHANLIDVAHGAAPGATPVNITTDLSSYCTDLVPQVGITSTPAIDPSTGTMYVETKSAESGTWVHRFHAIDITTGNEKAGSPVVVSASVPGTGDGSSGGTLTFDALHHMNRPGLLLLNGIVYVAYASQCDVTPFHGWLFAYDAASLARQAVFVTTPNGGLGGLWMAGAGVAGDSNGNIFISSGNGDFDTVNVPATEVGDAILKLRLGSYAFSLLDYFAPYDQASLDSSDYDVGSGGVTLLPDQSGNNAHELLEVGKEGTLYLINRDQMTTGNTHYCSGCSSNPEIIEELPQAIGIFYSIPTYWNENVFLWGTDKPLLSYSLSGGVLPTNPSSNSSFTVAFPGAVPVISASGTSNAILWAIDGSAYSTSGPAVLHAFRATNVASELYNSNQAQTPANRDQAGPGVKFSVPTVANGKVYIGTQTELDVYGILP